MVGEHSYSLLFSPAIYDSKHVPKNSVLEKLCKNIKMEKDILRQQYKIERKIYIKL